MSSFTRCEVRKQFYSEAAAVKIHLVSDESVTFYDPFKPEGAVTKNCHKIHEMLVLEQR